MPQPADLTVGPAPAARPVEADSLPEDQVARQHLQDRVAPPAAVAVLAVRGEAGELRA